MRDRDSGTRLRDPTAPTPGATRGGSNWKGYRNAQVTNLLRRSDATLDVQARMALVNRADAILANDLTTLPLYQKPTYFVFKTKLKGLQDNPTLQGPTWNVEHWRVG